MFRRWGPALLAALLCQFLLLLTLPNVGLGSRRARRAVSVDDTATLLRWSRTPVGMGQATSLNTIPLQGLAALPPPPPSTLPSGAVAGEPVRRQRSRVPVAAVSKLPLPAQPGEAFRLARQVALSGRPKELSPVLVNLQRRQWWLLPGQSRALQALWDGGKELESAVGLGPLPEDISLREVSLSGAEPLGLAELHGTSLLDGDLLWLLWRQGESLWLLRGSLVSEPPPGTAAPALTGS
jgi:hypothetical protein